MKKAILEALEAKYTAQIAEADATIKIYLENSVGIGEHPQHIEELDKLLQQIVDAQEKTMLMEADTGKGNYELDVVLRPWMLLSSDKEFVITTDIVATICEPIASIKDMYERKVTPVPLSETEVVSE